MKIIYKDNLIDDFLDYVEEGKVAIITYENESQIVNDIEKKLLNNKCVYQKYNFENLTNEDLEGTKNVFVIGNKEMCKKVSDIAIDYTYIPDDYNFDMIVFNKNLKYYPKKILFLNSINNKDLAVMLSYIIFYKVISLDIDNLYMDKDNIINVFVNLLSKDLSNYNEYFNMAQKFINYYEDDYAIFYLSLTILIIYKRYFNINNDLFIPVDFDEKIKTLSHLLNVSCVEILLKLKDLCKLDESLFIFNFEKQNYLKKVDIIYNQLKDYIYFFKNLFIDKGFYIKVDYKKILTFIGAYPILLNKKELLFQICLQGLV